MKTDDLESRLAAIADRRPPLIFTPERLDRLRARVAGNTRDRTLWENLRSRGRELLKLSWPEEPAAGSLHHHEFTYRKPAVHLSEVVRSLGLLHLIEPDERYAKKIREGLFYYMDEHAPYQTWCAPLFSTRQPGWRSELITTNLCFSHIAGLEILKGWLPATERDRIADTLVTRGLLPLMQDWLLPGTRIHCLDTMGHNWWVVCHSMAGIGALAMLGRHPEAASWVARIDRAMPLWFGYGGSVMQNRVGNFDSAGGYYEGVHYANYALGDYLLYRTALKDVLPDFEPQNAAALQSARQFLLHTLYPSKNGNLVVNFGDTKKDSAATTAMRLLAANDLAGEFGAWYVARTADDAAQPMALLFGNDQPIIPPDALPTSAVFPGTGVAVMRSGWEDDATLLAMRAGTYWIHAHADSGSFVLFHRGRPLIVDAGHCDYFHPEYTQYYAASQAHNVVLVNGRGAPPEDFVRGSKFPGRLHSLLDVAGLKYVYADATGPIAHLVKRHYRHWLWADGAIVIIDDLLAHEPSCFNWLLHYAGTAGWDARSATIRNEEAEAHVRFLHPENLAVREVEAPAQDTLDGRVKYLEYSTCELDRQARFLTVVTPQPPPGESAPRIERIEGLPGVRIIGEELATDVYFNLKADGRDSCMNPHASLEGWETDACLLAVTRKSDTPRGERSGLQRLLMVDGSCLRRDGVTLLDSLSRVDCLASLEPERVRIAIRGQREIDLLVHRETSPREVIVNGEPGLFDYLPEDRAVRCRIALPPDHS